MRKQRIKVVKVARKIKAKPHVFFAYSRTIFESFACIFVALETHFFVFSALLAFWLIIDIVAMLKGEI